MHAVDPSQKKPKQGLRTGFTTGACSAAAAQAAAYCIVNGQEIETIQTILPNQSVVTFNLNRCELFKERAICSIIKDGGDDPDCTHGAELIAEVKLWERNEFSILGGIGVATVTKPGLGLDVGGPAINPVPKKSIRELVEKEIKGTKYYGAEITISVPDGEERAKKTLNARLGLLGGISILGTTGIVLPYSTSAFIASVVQAISLAKYQGSEDVVFTTGGRSEQYAMKLLPDLMESAFIQVGDYVGIGIRNTIKNGLKKIYIVGMMGKLSKMADGKMMTHAKASEVNMKMLATFAEELGAPQGVVDEIKGANTARHVLEICTANGLGEMPSVICKKVVEKCGRFGRDQIAFSVTMVDFSGNTLGCFPPKTY